MKKAAVVVDNWKLPIFRKHLHDAGYIFTEGKGVTPDVTTITVEYAWVATLKPVIEAAQKECAKTKGK